MHQFWPSYDGKRENVVLGSLCGGSWVGGTYKQWFIGIHYIVDGIHKKIWLKYSLSWTFHFLSTYHTPGSDPRLSETLLLFPMSRPHTHSVCFHSFSTFLFITDLHKSTRLVMFLFLLSVKLYAPWRYYAWVIYWIPRCWKIHCLNGVSAALPILGIG